MSKTNKLSVMPVAISMVYWLSIVFSDCRRIHHSKKRRRNLNVTHFGTWFCMQHTCNGTYVKWRLNGTNKLSVFKSLLLPCSHTSPCPWLLPNSHSSCLCPCLSGSIPLFFLSLSLSLSEREREKERERERKTAMFEKSYRCSWFL